MGHVVFKKESKINIYIYITHRVSVKEIKSYMLVSVNVNVKKLGVNVNDLHLHGITWCVTH
jgi:hypothetical protein